MELPTPHDRDVPPDSEVRSEVSTAAVGAGRVGQSWRAEVLARVAVLRSMAEAAEPNAGGDARTAAVSARVGLLLEDAEANASRERRRRSFRDWWSGGSIERAWRNVHGAEILLAEIVELGELGSQRPALRSMAERVLAPTDARRIAIEQRLSDKEWQVLENPDPVRNRRLRREYVAALTWVSDGVDKNYTRARSFRNIVLATSVGLAAVAIALGVLGIISPTSLPLCFEPEQSGEIKVVCPTGASEPVPAPQPPAVIDDLVAQTAGWSDVLLVELVGLSAGGLAAAAAIRGLRGTSTPYGVPVAMAALKLPAGALTAVFGLLVMSGQFIPGLGALDTPAQIIAWAAIFGYAQQIFTRRIDQQATHVLDLSDDPYVAGRRTSLRAIQQLEQDISGAVEQSVRTALAPPRFVNVEGRLAAAWVMVGTTWTLQVTVRTGPGSRTDETLTDSRPFRLGGGETGGETQLEILVDLPGHVVDVGDRAVMIVTTDGSHSWTGSVDPAVAAPQEAWISISTYGRFLQAVAADA